MKWLDILKSTRVQAMLASVLFVAFGEKLGFTEEQLTLIVATICTYIAGRSFRPPVQE